tara:strand:- start:207 stop:779 length:573 start_codon:yes stop_codon:yes gene_type:complete
MHNNPLFFLFVSNYNLNELSNLKKNINIIYRNYDDNIDINSIKKIKYFCKKTNRKFFLSNNFKLAFKLNLNGVYIPAFNKKINITNKSLRKNFEIIGSAHNLTEIKIKEKQGCHLIFLSPLFKIEKNKTFLGITKFNLLTLNQKLNFIALGGISFLNFKKIYITNSLGFSGIKWIKKNGPRKILRPFLKF